MKQPVNVINSDPDYMMGWKSGQPVLVPKIGDGEIATFATDPLTGAVTGLVGPGGKPFGYFPGTASFEAAKRMREASIGTLLTNWVGATINANGTPVSGSAGVVTTDIAPDRNAAGNAVRLIGDAAIRGSVTVAFPAQSTGQSFTGISFWVKVKGRSQPVQTTQIYVGNGADPLVGKAIALTLGIPSDGKWHLVFIPRTQFVMINSFVLGTDTVQSILVRDREAAGIGYTGMLTSTEEMQLGPVYANPFSRPKFLIRMDDSISDMIVPRASGTFTADGVTQQWSHKLLMEKYGFGSKGSCFHLARRIGTSNARQTFVTATQMAELAAAGWSHCTQTYQDPVDSANNGVLLMGTVGYTARTLMSVDTGANTITASAAHNITLESSSPYYGYPVVFSGTSLPSPLTTGTTYWATGVTATEFALYNSEDDAIAKVNRIDLTTTGTAANFTYRYSYSANDTSMIQADLTNCINSLTALGYGDTAAIWAPNQGAMNEETRAASRAAGVKMVLGIGRTGAAYNTPMTRHLHCETSGGVGGGVKLLDSHLTVPSAIQTDGVPTGDNVRAYVNAVIAQGGVGSNYHHGLSAGNGPVLAAYLDELRLRVSEGVCDVVTAKELADYLEAARQCTTGVIL